MAAPMDISQIKARLKYVTDAHGDKTEVIVPVEVWNTVISHLPDVESGLHPIDELEDNNSILSDLQNALKQVADGESSPIAELWTGIDGY